MNRCWHIGRQREVHARFDRRFGGVRWYTPSDDGGTFTNDLEVWPWPCVRRAYMSPEMRAYLRGREELPFDSAAFRRASAKDWVWTFPDWVRWVRWPIRQAWREMVIRREIARRRRSK